MSDSNGSDTNGHLYQTNLTNHGVLIGAAGGVLSSTAVGSTGQVLQGNTGADPTYSTATFPSTAGSTGTILRSDGTNWVASTNTFPNTATTGDILIATGSNVIGSLADVAVHQVLVSGGVGTAPAYSATPTVTSITFGSGTALNTYAENTFTPVLSFNNGTTGITYSTQLGSYTRIGRMVYIRIAIVLTSKGSSTGNAAIGGLPFTSANDGILTPMFYAAIGTTKAASTYFTAYINPSATTLNLTFGSTTAGTLSGLNDTNFSGTDQIYISGFYNV